MSNLDFVEGVFFCEGLLHLSGSGVSECVTGVRDRLRLRYAF